MNQRAIPRELFELARTDPIIHSWMNVWMAGGYESFEAALIGLSLRLAEGRSDLLAKLIEAERYNAPNFTIGGEGAGRG